VVRFVALIGGASDKDEAESAEDTAAWWEQDDEGDLNIEDCSEDFDSTQPCEGDWTTTLCIHDVLTWWCEWVAPPSAYCHDE
jgi:hypothetical protein